MAGIDAVIFDFIGTLTDLVGYSLEKSEEKLFRSLEAAGYAVSQKGFFEAYKQTHQKYRKIRYEKLVEVTNAVWVSEALNLLGYPATPEDEEVKAAVNVFFEDYVTALRLRVSTRSTLRKLSQSYKLGLVSNFTYAPTIYAALRKLKINDHFSTVIVSEEVGWRKPSRKIFVEALSRMRVKAKRVVFVGDTPLEDISGARRLGMKTIFIPSQFKSLSDIEMADEQPDYYIRKVSDILPILRAQRS